MGHVMYMRKGDAHTAPVTLPVGTVWLFTSNGTFTVPENGKYQIEMHGGGGSGGMGYASMGYVYSGGGGGGSGELITLSLAKNNTYAITIGYGGVAPTATGDTGRQGGTTSFGSHSIAGGTGGAGNAGSSSVSGGAGSGSIATSGSNGKKTTGVPSAYPSGGYGNKNNTAQPYGNGGRGGSGNSSSDYAPTSGTAGAVIITYLGKE